MKSNVKFLISILTLVLLIGFQNCSPSTSPVSFSNQDSKTIPSADSGTPYEGKIYATIGNLCPDGSEIHARIILSSATKGELNRDDCHDITPVQVTNADFQLDLVSDSLTYRNQAFNYIGTGPLGITNFTYSNDVNNFYYGYSYEGSPSWLQVYLDTDNDPTTGYYYNGIGADFMIENDNVWKYSAPQGAPQSTWAWNSVVSANKNIVGQSIRWSFSKSAIGSPAILKIMAHTSYGTQSPIITQTPQ